MGPRRMRVYPATVAWEHEPAAAWRKVLAILEGSCLSIYGKAAEHRGAGRPTHLDGVVLLDTLEVAGHRPVPGRRTEYLVDVVAGGHLRISEQGHCGCKDVLKGFAP